MKVNKELFEKILPQIEGFSLETIKEQLFSIAGFKEGISIAEQIRNVKFPLVMIEDIPDGYIGFNSGFCDYRSVSFWVLCKADIVADNRKDAYNRAFKIGTEILKHLVATNINYEGGSDVWIDSSRISYFARGPLQNNVYGFEFALMTREEISLEL